MKSKIMFHWGCGIDGDGRGCPPPQTQIAGAILAAPAELREGAAVLGYNAEGGSSKLREGKNEMICLASDPTKTAFNVACYHKDLEPFMARGRELRRRR